MLVLPNVVQELLHPSRRRSRRRRDEERGGEHISSNTSGHTKRLNHVGFRRRPPHLGLEEPDDPHDFLDDPTNDDCTRTYRLLPIFAGIMVPFSIMLSIPSLTGHWYIRTGENNVLLETRPNPPLLDAAMVLSMVCGILASACLVVRFAERKIQLMTMLCMIFLTLHDLINIPAVTIFGVEHRFDDGFTYGQSFWFTVCSTIASTSTNITLITDYCQTEDFTHSGSGLTHKQRSLVIIVIVLLCYVSLGSLILAVMLKVNFIDALYLSIVSIETIGFGDLHPTSTGTRIFMCIFVAGGILNLALAVALTRDALLESATVNIRLRLKAAQARRRERHIRTRWRAAVRWRLRANGLPTWVDDREEERILRVGLRQHRHWYSWLRRVWRRLLDEVWREWEDPAWKYVYGPRKKRLNLEALTQSQLETAALEAGAPLSELVPKGLKLRGESTPKGDDSGPEGLTAPNPNFPTFETGGSIVVAPSLTHVRIGGMASLLGKFAFAITYGAQEEEPQNDPTLGNDVDDSAAYDDTYPPTTVRRGVPFSKTTTMTTMQEDETSLTESYENVERNAFRARLAVALTLFIVFWMAGSAIFMRTEQWNFGSAVYFCKGFVSFTTVGYGDFAPTTPAGRSIFVVWALLGVGTMTILISILAEGYSNQYKSVIKSENVEDSSNAFDDGHGARHGFYHSRTIINTEKDPDSFRTHESVLSSNAIKFARNLTPNMAPIPDLQLTGASTPAQAPNVGLEALPHRVLKHADALRSLIATALPEDGIFSADDGAEYLENELSRSRSLRMEKFLFEIEKSLQDLASAANDALEKQVLDVP